VPELDWSRMAGLCGILAPVVNLSAVFLAILLSPWFSWSANALSDLGVAEAALLFNTGLMLGGILTVVLAAGLFSKFKGQTTRRAGALLLFLAAVELFGVGVFSEAAGIIHFYFSVAFFMLLPIALLVIGAGAIAAKSRKFGAFTIILGILAGLPWAFSWSAEAVPEMLSALAVSAWCIAQGAILYFGKT